jgi:hypothetical protein
MSPDEHVVIRHPCTVLCLMCGRSYKWNTPVPIPLFCAGNEAWAKDHDFCPEWRQEWRARLLATLALRRDTLGA